MPTLDELSEARNSAIARINNTSAVEKAPLMDNLAALGNALAADHALITAQQQRIAALEAALEPFADDWHWFLDWNKRNPDHPKTHSEFSWLGQIDPVSYDDAFRRAYDLLHADTGEKGERG